MGWIVFLLFLAALTYSVGSGVLAWLRENLGKTNEIDANGKKVEDGTVQKEKIVEYTLENAIDAHRASKEFVLSQVKKKGGLLEYASEELKNDKQVVLKAVEDDGCALKFASQKLRENKEVVLAAVSNSGIALQYASEQLKDEKEVVLAAVGNDGYWYDWETHEIEVLRYKKDSHSTVLSHVSDRLKSDREVVLKAVRNDRMSLEYADAQIKQDAKFILQLLEEDLIMGHDVKWHCSALLSDYDFAYKAVQLDSFLFEELPAEFKSDEKIVLAALSKSTMRLNGNPLFKDKEFVLKALQLNVRVLQELVPEDLRKDRDVVLQAVKQNGIALSFAAPDYFGHYPFSNDLEIALEAVKTNGLALRYTSFKDNRKVVLEAVRNNGRALMYASKEFTNDIEIVLAALRSNPEALFLKENKLNEDTDVIKAATLSAAQKLRAYCDKNPARKNYYAYKCLSDVFGGFDPYENLSECEMLQKSYVKTLRWAILQFADKNDIDRYKESLDYSDFFDERSLANIIENWGYKPNIWHYVVKENLKLENYGLTLEDYDFVLNLSKIHGLVVPFADPNLRADRDVIRHAVKTFPEALSYASEEIKADKDIVIEAVSCDGSVLRHASDELRVDKEVVLVAISVSDYALEYASEELREDRDFIKAVIINSPAAFEYAADSLRNDLAFISELVSINRVVLEYGGLSDSVKAKAILMLKKKESTIPYTQTSEAKNIIEETTETIKSKDNMTYLFFDTETTGLPKNWKAPASDTQNWPRLVQLGWIQFDSSGNELGRGNHIIKPDGFIIPVESSNVHGKTHEYAMQNGEDLNGVLSQFQRLVSESSVLVAHNMSFDEKVVGAEFYRASMSNVLVEKPRECTMESSTDYCAIEGPYGYKWPSLSELHIKLFGFDFEGAHDAMADIEATAKCFWELRKRGIL